MLKVKIRLKDRNEKIQTNDKTPKESCAVIKLDEDQVREMMEYLDSRMDDYCQQLEDTIKCSRENHSKKSDAFSSVIKILIAILFSGFGVLLLIGTIMLWSTIFTDATSSMAGIVVLIISITCIAIGIGVFKEKDRQYIVSMFSALVAMAALVVAYMGIKS